MKRIINYCLRLYAISAIVWPILLGLFFLIRFLFLSEQEQGLSGGFSGAGEWFFGCVIAFFLAIPYFVFLTFVFSFFNIGTNIISSGTKSLMLSLFALIVSILIIIVNSRINTSDSDMLLFLLSIIIPPVALYLYFYFESLITKTTRTNMRE